MKLPDGWNDYERIGKRINGTRFIAFKVPLHEHINKTHNVDEAKQLYPKLLLTLLPNLGMIIDLTNTSKYYAPEDILSLGIAYDKINVEGHKIPSKECSKRFHNAVNKFLAENQDNDKLIGVHCTHGLNRTGFMVGRYMIEEMHIPPLQAIAAFEVARGHQIERKNYTDYLKTLKHEVIESVAIDTEFNKGTQTQRGFWINEDRIRTRKRGHQQTNPPHLRTEGMGPQVSLVGCVNIQKTDLIPDGRGGFFVHIGSKDIDQPQSHHGHNNMRRQAPLPPPQQQRQMIPPSSHQINSRLSPNQRRSRFHPDQAYARSSHPRSNQYLAEDLLGINSRQRSHAPPPPQPQTDFSRDYFPTRGPRKF